MAVIPKTTKVIVWDKNELNQAIPLTSTWPQRFAVGDPVTGVFDNYVVQVPAGWGDLFCAGQCWLPDGKLFVAGGNSRYTPVYDGSQLAAIWDPAFAALPPLHGWNFLSGQPMNKKRWYPTVTLFLDTSRQPRVMVAGGIESTANNYCANGTGPGGDGAFNTYEVWNIATNDWERQTPTSPPTLYDGPLVVGQNCLSVLGEYPRLHLLSTNRVFLAGMFTGANRVRHDELLGPPQIWEATPPWTSSPERMLGSSILVPNVGHSPGADNLVMVLGGGDYATQSVVSDNRVIDAAAINPVWSQSNPIGDPYAYNFPRMVANVVLLPTGEVVAMGGSSNYYDPITWSNNTPVFDTEIFSKTTGWVVDSAQSSERMYHSTAALLPSGHVVSAGSDQRSSDYEIYSPPYLNTGLTRPDFAGAWSRSNPPGWIAMQFGQTYVIDHAPLPVGVTVSRVVLMRPCSTTHHSDMDQRYVELVPVVYKPPQYSPPDTITVRAPVGPTTSSMEAPPGFYMAFLISSQGIPSQAKWVLLQ